MEPRKLDLDARRQAPKPFPTELLLPREQRLRRQPRDPDEERALTRLILAKVDLYRRSGKVEFINARERRFHIGREKILDYLRRQEQL